ncbi:MAG: TonB-dependent receptor [Ignavibacteria bacterium]|jgi:hypothetical protein
MNYKFFVVLICFLLSEFIYSQNTGKVQGKIIDETTKQPLVGANVVVLETDFGSTTDENGIFAIENLSEGIYKIKISYIGYNTHIEPDIKITGRKTYYVKEIELIETPIEGEEVVVSSGLFNYEKDMPVSNYTYTEGEINRAPGAIGDIFRALESLPGVSTNGGEFSAFSVRGDTPQDNIILLDNIPFYGITHFSELDGDTEIQGGRLSVFTHGMVQKAKFQAGGFSSKYGGKRASLLNLSIKEGNKQSPNVWGAFDLLGWEARYNGPVYIAPNSSILFSFRKIDFSNILKLLDEEGEGTTKFDDLILKTTTDLNSSNKISILGIYSTEEHRRDVYHYLKSKEYDDLDLAKDKEEKTLLGLNWRTLTGSEGYLQTSIYYGKMDQKQVEGKIIPDPIYDRKLKEDEIVTRNTIYDYHVDQEQFGVKFDFTYNFSKKMTLNTGFSAQQVKSKTNVLLNGADTLYVFDSEEISGPNKYLVVTPDEFNSSFDNNRMEYACYLETSLSPAKKLDFNLGVRYEYDDLTDDNLFSPRFSGSYKLSPFSSINFAAGLYYQLPRMREIAFNENNKYLKNEKSYHFIIGYSHYLANDLKFNAESYYKILDDLIVEHNSNTNLAINSGKGYSYGVDLSLIKRFVKNIYGQINYSYSQCRLKDDDSDAYYDSDFNQPHMFNILFGYQINDHWTVSVKWKYASGKPKDEFIVHENVLNDINKPRYSKELISNNTKRYIEYHSMNLRINYHTRFTNFLAANIYLDIMNVYNRENELGESFNEISGKNSFSDFPMVPSIGLRLEM